MSAGTEPAAAAKPDTHEERWVYAGIRQAYLAGGKTVVVFHPLDERGAARTEEGGALSERIYTDGKVFRRFAVGYVYRVHTNAAGTSLSTGGDKAPQMVGRWDDARRVEIEAAHETAKVLIEAERREKAAKTDTALDDAIAQLRRCYRKTFPGAPRRAFLAYVIDKVTTGGAV